MSLTELSTRRLVLTGVSIHVGGLADGSSRLTPGTLFNPLRHVLKPTKLE